MMPRKWTCTVAVGLAASLALVGCSDGKKPPAGVIAGTNAAPAETEPVRFAPPGPATFKIIAGKS